LGYDFFNEILLSFSVGISTQMDMILGSPYIGKMNKLSRMKDVDFNLLPSNAKSQEIVSIFCKIIVQKINFCNH